MSTWRSASYSPTASAITNAEVIPYTDRAGTQVAELNGLNWADVRRLQLYRHAASEDPEKPGVAEDTVDLNDFFLRAIKEGLVEVLIQRYSSGFALEVDADDTLVLEPISYANSVLDCYAYFVSGSLGALGGSDSGGNRLSFRIPSRHLPVPGLMWALISFLKGAASVATALVNAIKDAIAAIFVRRSDLAGHEDDFYSYGYNEGILQAGQTDKRYGWAVASSDGSAAPVQADVYTQAKLIAAGARTLIVPKTMWASIPANFEPDSPHIVTQAQAASVLNAHSVSPKRTVYPTFAATGAAVSVGQGNAAYWYVPVTVTWVGDPSTGLAASDNGNVWKLSAHDPSTLDVDLPYEAIGNPPWLLTDGRNVTAETKEAIQGSNETEVLGNFTRVAAGLASQGDDRWSYEAPTLTLSVAGDSDYESAGSNTNDAKLYRALKERAWLVIGGWEIAIKALTQRYTSSGGRAQYQVDDFDVVRGAAPALASVSAVSIVGEDVHRGQISGQAYREEDPNIGGKGGTKGQAWLRGSGDEDADWGWPEVKRYINADVGSSAENIANNVNDDDIIHVQIRETISGSVQVHTFATRYFDIGTGMTVSNTTITKDSNGNVLAQRGSGASALITAVLVQRVKITTEALT